MTTVNRPKPTRFDAELIRDLFAITRGSRWEPVVCLGLISMRAPEILGLKWSEVASEEIFVRGHLDRDGRRVPSKTGGTIVTPLPSLIRTRLEEHRRREAALGHDVGPDAFVIQTQAGQPMRPARAHTEWRVFLAGNGRSWMSLHDLRTMFLSLVLHYGMTERERPDKAGEGEDGGASDASAAWERGIEVVCGLMEPATSAQRGGKLHVGTSRCAAVKMAEVRSRCSREARSSANDAQHRRPTRWYARPSKLSKSCTKIMGAAPDRVEVSGATGESPPK